MEQLKKQQAQSRIMFGEAASLPHMDEEARNNWSRDIDEILQIERKAVTSPAMFKSIGIGVYKE